MKKLIAIPFFVLGLLTVPFALLGGSVELSTGFFERAHRYWYGHRTHESGQ
jgi:hypothetical protein